ncbi:MAG: hypothetical protein COV99_11840 [Bacteroidetes bacterium CG12_big_fil_rev_8_21_14_0_65_60_17]|nr:MAG: hypothetical protein COV99_11840 [Bacteroidetes bacterium CG12_big_fil_rev_8_21_14_0_65_60_17]
MLLLVAGCQPQPAPDLAAGPVPVNAMVDVDGLGRIYFPNSGNEQAQEPFYRGVLLLHSFEFGRAAEAFREAQQADSSFALAYWGEAMTYNHPLWRDVDLEAGREALRRLAPSHAERRQRAGTPREAMYLDAVEELYVGGEEGAAGGAAESTPPKSERDRNYMEAMKKLHLSWPYDDEARTFYALSILGLTNGERDFRTYMQAAAVAQPVFERNPRHPGAAHYLIHSFDDPVHAPLGLPAADAYADVAPGAGHAQHMTTHIFVALGLWERVVENNRLAVNTIHAQRGDQDPAPWACGHYASWQHYGHLQLGQWTDAEALMDACYEWVQAGDVHSGQWGYFASMRSLHLLEAAPPFGKDGAPDSLWLRWVADVPDGRSENAPDGRPDNRAVYLSGQGLALLRAGDVRGARNALSDMPVAPAGNHVIRLQLEGLLALETGRARDGVAKLEDAAREEAALPFAFGPPEVPKPSHELLAEELYRMRDLDRAAQAYESARQRTPGRRLLERGAQVVSDQLDNRSEV